MSPPIDPGKEKAEKEKAEKEKAEKEKAEKEKAEKEKAEKEKAEKEKAEKEKAEKEKAEKEKAEKEKAQGTSRSLPISEDRLSLALEAVAHYLDRQVNKPESKEPLKAALALASIVGLFFSGIWTAYSFEKTRAADLAVADVEKKRLETEQLRRGLHSKEALSVGLEAKPIGLTADGGHWIAVSVDLRNGGNGVVEVDLEPTDGHFEISRVEGVNRTGVPQLGPALRLTAPPIDRGLLTTLLPQGPGTQFLAVQSVPDPGLYWVSLQMAATWVPVDGDGGTRTDPINASAMVSVPDSNSARSAR